MKQERRNYHSILFFIYLFYFLSNSVLVAQDSTKEELAESLCGPYALMIVAKIFGINVDVYSISELAGTTSQGTSMKGLADAAHQLGLQSRGMKLTIRQLMNLKPPVIAYVNRNHFFVIDQILEDKLSITDINQELRSMSREEFEKIWDGHVLTISSKRINGENGETVPNIQVEKLVYDFGVMDSNQVIEHTFIIQNTGDANLVVRDILLGCACSEATISKEIIPPNEQGSFLMKFDLQDRWGQTAAVAKVLTNDPYQPILTFVITGVSKTILPVSPSRIILSNIPNKDKGKPLFHKIRIRDSGTSDLRIQKVTTSSGAVRAKVFQEKRGADGEIHIWVTPEKCNQMSTDGRFEEYITIHTNNSQSPKINVSINGEIGSPIRVIPKRLFFGFVKSGDSVSQSVVVASDTETDWNIVNVETSLDEVLIEVIPVTAGQKYRIDVTLLSDKPRSNIIEGHAKLHTDYTEQSVIKIPIYAVIQ